MGVVYYPNLKAEMARYGITSEALSSVLGMSRPNLYNKINGKNAWTLADMKSVQNYLNDNSNGVSYTLDYLFKETLDENLDQW